MRSVTAAMRGSRVMAARSGRGCGRSFRGSLPGSGTPVHAQSRPRGGEGEADREFQRVGAVHRAFEQASLVLAADQQDRKRAVVCKRGSGRLGCGGRRLLKIKKE